MKIKIIIGVATSVLVVLYLGLRKPPDASNDAPSGAESASVAKVENPIAAHARTVGTPGGKDPPGSAGTHADEELLPPEMRAALNTDSTGRPGFGAPVFQHYVFRDNEDLKFQYIYARLRIEKLMQIAPAIVRTYGFSDLFDCVPDSNFEEVSSEDWGGIKNQYLRDVSNALRFLKHLDIPSFPATLNQAMLEDRQNEYNVAGVALGSLEDIHGDVLLADVIEGGERFRNEYRERMQELMQNQEVSEHIEANERNLYGRSIRDWDGIEADSDLGKKWQRVLDLEQK